MRRRLAEAVLRVAALLVPRDERSQWREEWAAELHALHAAGGRSTPAGGLPDPLRFAAGALPHALWLRVEGWSPRGLGQDVRLAVRMLARSPGFAITAMLTLALGIGVNGAMFSLVNGLALRPPAGVAGPSGLVQIGRVTDADPVWGTFSWPAARLLIDDPGSPFSDVGGFSLHQFAVGEGGDAERVIGHFVTGTWFGTLGTVPALGRLIQPDDDVVVGGHPVVVLGHGLWTRRFGADPAVVGSRVDLDGAPYEVVGVAPEGFVGIHNVGLRPELFVPAVMNPGYGGSLPFSSWRWSWLSLVGRWAPEAEAGSRAEVAARWTDRLREAHPDNAGARIVTLTGVGVEPFSRERTGGLARMLASIVGVVLLLTCAAVANLSAARGSHRTAEMAVRKAVGGSRFRVARQLVVESAVLAAGAVALAVPMVVGAVSLLPGFVPLDLIGSIVPDLRVWVFLIGIGAVVALACGLAPAWLATRPEVAAGLRGGVVASASRGGRLRDGLVVVQLGLSLGLVAGAVLLARSVLAASAADPGFESRGLQAAFVRLSFDEWDAESSVPWVEDVTARLGGLPGVTSVAVATQLPIAGGQSLASFAPLGREAEEIEVELAAVGPRYFETLGIPLTRGRPIGSFADEGERVAIVSEGLARRFWPGEDPVGRMLAGDPAWRVVGVAADVQMRSLRSAPNPAVYVPFTQAWQPGLAFAIATEADGGPTVRSIEDAVAQVAPDIDAAVVDVRRRVLASLDDARRVGTLVAAFAGLALLLAGVGLYGVVAIGAARRRKEFGVRMALGARPASVVRATLSRVGRMTAVGLLVGTAITAVVGRTLEAVLFRTSAYDPGAWILAAVVLGATALVAAWWPARRAARIDVATCLRE